MRRLLVTGSRDWSEDHTIWGVLSGQVRESGPFVMVHGASATGTDALAHEWLYLEDPYCDLPCCDPVIQRQMRQLEEPHPADAEKYGHAAAPTRNQQMVDAGADVCLAFLLPNSRGSIDCMVRARIAGIPVIEYHAETGPMTDERGTVCCSACVHPAIDHDNSGCHVYGRFDDCSCSGYEVDPLDLT